MENIKKVLANADNGFLDGEKLQALTNIGAIGGVKVTTSSGTSELVPDSDGKVTVDLTDAERVQSDWAESAPAAPSYIQNKPDLAIYAEKVQGAISGDVAVLDENGNIQDTGVASANLVHDPDYVHTDNNFTDAEQSKLSGIAAGAEVNVQSNWTESDSSSDAYIQNKPSLAAVATSGSYNDLTDKPDIPGSQVQSDWTEANTASKAYILHKPNLAAVATSGSYTDLSDKPTIPAAQVNSDWNANSGVARILNKPNLATVATSGSYTDLSNKPTIPAAQVQSDWAQTNTAAVDYIKNKPAALVTKPLVAGNYVEFVQGTNDVTLNVKPPIRVILYSGSPQMTQDQMTAISQMVSANGVATILYGSSGGTTYWNLIRNDSSGYDFGYVYNNTLSVMHVSMGGYVSITRQPIGGPVAYNLGTTDFFDNPVLSGQNSDTHLREHSATIANPVTLVSGKNYLITSNCGGTAEWTVAAAVTATAKRWSVYIALTQSDFSLSSGKYVNVGEAQFYFNDAKGSRTAGYHFNVGIHGLTTVISPATTLTLNSVVIWNGGNVLGASSGNTATMYMDYSLGNLSVQEIP